uniref:Uncharacterized protein n=1 Tax=Arundo donax TaxID=35708 RepID=A0A0A9AT79_ARUDO
MIRIIHLVSKCHHGILAMKNC